VKICYWRAVRSNCLASGAATKLQFLAMMLWMRCPCTSERLLIRASLRVLFTVESVSAGFVVHLGMSQTLHVVVSDPFGA